LIVSVLVQNFFELFNASHVMNDRFIYLHAQVIPQYSLIIKSQATLPPDSNVTKLSRKIEGLEIV
jgi:hypothetical protein